MKRKNNEFSRDKKDLEKFVKVNCLGKKAKGMCLERNVFFSKEDKFDKNDLNDLMSTVIFPEDIDEVYALVNKVFCLPECVDLNELDLSRYG